MELMTLFAIATFAISQVQWFSGLFGDATDTNHEEVMAKLKEINDITMTTQKGVNELLVATDFMDEQLQLAEAETKIFSHFDRMRELKFLNADTNQWDTWAAEVVDGNSGTSYALSVINYQISQNNVIGKFKVKAEAAKRNKRLLRTVVGSITDYFKLQIIFQMLGFTMLREANKHRGDWSRMNYEYKIMIQRFNGQIQQFGEEAAWLLFRSQIFGGYFKNENFQHNCLRMTDVRYAHLGPVEADRGKVVTGVQLYKYGNRVALKIKQGRLRENGRIDSESWKGATGWGERGGTDYIQIYKGNEHYIHLYGAKAPMGKALVGISLYKNGNRLAIKVKVASVDYLNGNIDGGGKWIGSPGWGHNYYSTHDHDWRYIDILSVETKPPSMLTAAAFYRKGNRLAIKVSDIFEPPVQGMSCPTYSNVKMIGSYGCCGGFLYKRSGSGSLKLDNSIPYLLVGSAWMPICGHYFWDNNIGADIVCHNLGYSQGGVLEKERGLYSKDAYYVGRCDSRSITDLVNGCTKKTLAAKYSCKKGRPVSIKVKCKGTQTIQTCPRDGRGPKYVIPDGKCTDKYTYYCPARKIDCKGVYAPWMAKQCPKTCKKC